MWNNCVYTFRSSGVYISFNQGGPTNYWSHLPAPVAIVSGEGEYIYIYIYIYIIRVNCLRILINDLKFMVYDDYNQDVVK